MAKPITDKQREVLDFIVSFKAEHQHAPSQLDIQRHFKWRSRNTVLRYLDALETKGKIARTPGRHRNISIAA